MVQIKSNTLLSAYGAIKTAASKAAGKLYGNKNELQMRFYKEDFMWYADVKGWPGPKGMLLMVDGADTFLDYLSNNGNEISLDLSLDPKQGYDVLNYRYPHPGNDGAYYSTQMGEDEHLLWLCGVTEFVFGYMPEEVWYRK
jgi:hypothetical protein